jgi:hypothetical protein
MYQVYVVQRLTEIPKAVVASVQHYTIRVARTHDQLPTAEPAEIRRMG